VKLAVYGKLSEQRPLLVVSNHLSYMDIILLSSCGHFRFTPKSEIAKWPFIGYLCRIADCVFVERKPGKVKETSNTIHQALERGDVVSIFPEATTGSGVHVLPFKSSFFNLAERQYTPGPLHIQPVAMTYTQVSNLPVDHRLWPQIAWVGDDELLPHLWNFLSLSPVQAELHFLPPITQQGFTDRKALAVHSQKQIEECLDKIRAREYGPKKVQNPSAAFSLLKGKTK
ncbi:MAG: lysophospholipid acyltransferase family protein, partial [Alphaproteobacteria bacterium]